MLTHWNQKFLRIQENLEKCFLAKLAKCAARESFQGRRSEHSSGKFGFLFCLVLSQGVKWDLFFPQRTGRTTNSLVLQEFSLSVWGSKYRLNSDVCWGKTHILFFKHMYLKKTSLLEKWTNTAAVCGGVSFYCPNRKWSRSIGKSI